MAQTPSEMTQDDLPELDPRAPETPDASAPTAHHGLIVGSGIKQVLTPTSVSNTLLIPQAQLTLSFQMWTSELQDALVDKKRGCTAFRGKDLNASIDSYTGVRLQWLLTGLFFFAMHALHMFIDQGDEIEIGWEQEFANVDTKRQLAACYCNQNPSAPKLCRNVINVKAAVERQPHHQHWNAVATLQRQQQDAKMLFLHEGTLMILSLFEFYHV
ncbi:hypothetical protein Tco_0869373 [Tanacetum coccineum]